MLSSVDLALIVQKQATEFGEISRGAESNGSRRKAKWCRPSADVVKINPDGSFVPNPILVRVYIGDLSCTSNPF